jgi:Sec-independent protein translocase protein TatA
MSIGIGQVLVILLLVLLFFGKYPHFLKDITTGLHNIRSLLKTSSNIELPKKIEDNVNQRKDLKNDQDTKI